MPPPRPRAPRCPDSSSTGEPDPAGRLAGLPVWLRTTIYTLVFWATVLGLLAWALNRIDAYWPGLHVEIGWFRCVGAAVLLMGAVAYVWSCYVLTQQGKGPHVEFDPPRELVCVGPYARVRNPVAASVLLMILGEAVLFSSSGMLLGFLLGVLLANVQVVCLEEPLLRRRFGKVYEQYCRQVPRWLPRSWPPRDTRPPLCGSRE